MKKMLLSAAVVLTAFAANAQAPYSQVNRETDQSSYTMYATVINMIDIDPEGNSANAFVNSWNEVLYGIDVNEPAIFGDQEFEMWLAATREYEVTVDATDFSADAQGDYYPASTLGCFLIPGSQNNFGFMNSGTHSFTNLPTLANAPQTHLAGTTGVYNAQWKDRIHFTPGLNYNVNGGTYSATIRWTANLIDTP